MYPAKNKHMTIAIPASKRVIVRSLTLKSLTLKSIHIPHDKNKIIKKILKKILEYFSNNSILLLFINFFKNFKNFPKIDANHIKINKIYLI